MATRDSWRRFRRSYARGVKKAKRLERAHPPERLGALELSPTLGDFLVEVALHLASVEGLAHSRVKTGEQRLGRRDRLKIHRMIHSLLPSFHVCLTEN